MDWPSWLTISWNDPVELVNLGGTSWKPSRLALNVVLSFADTLGGADGTASATSPTSAADTTAVAVTTQNLCMRLSLLPREPPEANEPPDIKAYVTEMFPDSAVVTIGLRSSYAKRGLTPWPSRAGSRYKKGRCLIFPTSWRPASRCPTARRFAWPTRPSASGASGPSWRSPPA